MRKAISLATSALLLFALLILPAYAADLDPDRAGSITVTMIRDDKPVSGGTLTIYGVARMDSGGKFQYVQEYAACGVSLDEIGPDGATDLAAYTYYNQIQGQTKQIGSDGVVKFEDLMPGQYLLIQWEAAEGFYELSPFLIGIPTCEDGTYIYDIASSPKQAPSEPTQPSEPTKPFQPTEPSEPTEPPKPTEPEGPKLPQTGQTNWPIPLLAVAGIFFVILGAMLITQDVRRHDEA